MISILFSVALAAGDLTVCAPGLAIPAATASDPRQRCAVVCPHRDPLACAAPDDEQRDAWGRPHRRLEVVVDGVGAWLRFTEPPPRGTIKAVLIQHTGNAGTEWGYTRSHALDTLVRDGLRTVSVRWHPDATAGSLGAPTGWLTTYGDVPLRYRDVSARPAAIVRFVHDHLQPSRASLGLLGNSNGAWAWTSAMTWHDLDPIVDYALLSSPAIVWDLMARCKVFANQNVMGVCEQAPTIDCKTDEECGGGRNRCAFPAMSADDARRHDRWMHTDHACQLGVSTPRLVEGGLSATPTDLSWDHPTDLVIGEGGARRADADDTTAGFTWQDAMFWRSLDVTHTKGGRWIDLQPFYHGAAVTHPKLQAHLRCAVRRGLDLGPLCPEQRRP